MTSKPVLSLREYGAAFGERIVLGSINLAIPARGVFVLMGPAGTGKSTLLRSLAGVTDAAPSFRRWGSAEYAGAPLGAGESPVLVAQNARLMMSSVFENIVHSLPERESLTVAQQRRLAARLLGHAGLTSLSETLDVPVVGLPAAVQRHLAIARTTAANPRLLCVDEPTTDLGADEAHRLIRYMRAEAKRRAILVVVHNQQHARMLGGNTALLAGGAIQECRPTEEFFNRPRQAVTQDFVRTGSCNLPSPGARAEDLDESVRPTVRPVPVDAGTYVSDAFGPRGFLWLKKGLLAGTPRPGVFLDVDYDLKALQRVGIRVLVSLTETPMEAELLARYGIAGFWSPVEDMAAPTIEQAKEVCSHVAGLTAQGQAVAYHCKAGLGRTGTFLAAQLIWEGSTALDALERVRRIEPRWVQSDEQVAFLERFAQVVADQRRDVVVMKNVR